MDDQKLASVARSLRIRLGMTQSELARRSGVSRSTISRLERGHLEALTLKTTRQIGRHLDLRVQLEGAWRGGDLQRVMNAGHSAMHEAMIAIFERIDGWEIASEVSFSIYGERGVIDMLAFNAQGRVVLVVELKTEIVDGQALVGTMDRRRRLALKIATERGWQAEVAAMWVVVADTRSNRRRLALQVRLLRHAFPTTVDGYGLGCTARTGPCRPCLSCPRPMS